MEKTKSFFILLGLVLCLNGCVVLSFGPFCTEKEEIETPVFLRGEWRPIILEGDDVSARGITPWDIAEDRIVAYDEQNVCAPIDVVFFMIDGHLFCDSIAGSADEKDANAIWLYHLLPMHSISKVVHKDNTLTFVPLDYEWLEKAMSNKTVTLPAMPWEDMMLFTATPQEWRVALKACASHDKAFNEEHAFVFKRAGVKGDEG